MAERSPLAEIHRLMGEAAAAFGRGDVARAAMLGEQALALQPGMPEALHLTGLCALARGDLAGALTRLERAASLKPAEAQLIHNLGIARMQAGDAAGAREAFARAAALDPRNAESWFNLAVVSGELGDAAAAERAYRRALELAPGHAGAASGLAALCEQGNQLEEAGRWTEVALKADPADAVAHLTRAQLDSRAGHQQEAAARLETLLRQPLTARNRALAAGRLGAAFDKLGSPERAWTQYLAAKAALQVTLTPPTAEGPYGFAAAERVAAQLDALLAGLPAFAADAAAPVFLVGFPRSGTTLLDQMLSSHPGIAVLEEQDTLQDFLGEFALSDARLETLSALDAAALMPWRERYWRRVESFMQERPRGKVLVDKLPLNSVFMPLLARLFPGARFIFALRDPRDVVLSCFMQTFTLNEAMRHFLSLAETARYYAAVMGVAARAEAGLGPRVLRIRYEDVVADTEKTARRLLEFLELSWDPAVLSFHETARQRRINTPSYQQVVQPVYGSARERWRKYADELKPVLPVLEPFVKMFGYS